MSKRMRADILGCYVDLLGFPDVIEKIKAYIKEQEPRHIITLNAEIVYAAQYDQRLKDIINEADLVTPDGIGIVWAARHLGYEIKERITGIDLLYSICQEAAQLNWKMYFLGAAPGVADEAAVKLCQQYPDLKITGTRDGYFTDDEIPTIIDSIREQSPQILFVALGAPKQEVWIRQYKEQLGIPICIGVGGSFDVVAGNKRRAPDWMIRLNLEWLYRLIDEPTRIRRQLALPRFVAMILRVKH